MRTSDAKSQSFLTKFTNSLNPKPVAIIYLIGILFWCAITVALGYKSGGIDIVYLFSDDFGENWQTAFLWSLVVVAVVSLLYCIKSRGTWLSIPANTMVYAAPYALFLLSKWSLDALYWHHSETLETIKIFGPLIILFYVIGTLYMWWRAPRGRDESLPFFMLATITPVLLVMGMTAFNVLRSKDYIYQNAFGVVLDQVRWDGNDVKIDGSLVLNKAGNYEFSALSNEGMDIYMEEPPKPLDIKWQDSQEPSETGTYKFQIQKSNAQTLKKRREARYAEDPDLIGFGGPDIYLQINLKSEDGKKNTYIKSLPIWLEEFIEH